MINTTNTNNNITAILIVIEVVLVIVIVLEMLLVMILVIQNAISTGYSSYGTTNKGGPPCCGFVMILSILFQVNNLLA